MELKKVVAVVADEIPEDFRCAITGQVMFDPVVVVKSEHTYEREAILAWLAKNNTDPQTRVVLDTKDIIDNRTLKRVIDQYLSKNVHLYEDEDLVYLPLSLKKDLVRSITDSNIQLFRDCLSKHPGLLSVALNDLNETLIDILLAQNRSDYLEKFLLRLYSFSGKSFSARLSRYRDQYRKFCRILVLSKEESACKAMEQLLLESKQDELNQPDEKGLCLVHYAAMAGNLTQWRLLISRGADSLKVVGTDDNGEDDNGLNAFMIACAKGFTDIVSAYLSASPKVNLSATTTYKGKEVKEVSDVYYFAADCTAAQLAAFHGHQSILEQLIHRDPEIIFQNSRDENEDKLTLLDFAIIGNQSALVSWLLTQKKLSENPDLDKHNIFQRAVRRCHKEIILVLWENGFRPLELKNLFHDAVDFLSYDIDLGREDEKKHKSDKFQTVYPTLIKMGADLDARVDGNHVIHHAARSGLSDIVIFLLQTGVKPDIENDEGDTILTLAIEQDNIKLFNELLRHSVNIHCVNSEGNTLLHLARSSEIIDSLLSRGLDINALNKKKKTPLIYHLEHRRFQSAQCLVERNADVSSRDEDGKSALMYVCVKLYWSNDDALRKNCLESILSKNPDVKLLDEDGNTVLHTGRDISIVEPIVNYLERIGVSDVERNAYLNTQNNAGETVLMVICENSWSGSQTANFLLDHGADPRLINKKGEQAIHLLFKNIGSGDSQYKLAFAERLLKRGVSINAPINQDGDQPLHLAVKSNSEVAVSWLLEHGADKVGLSKRNDGQKDLAIESALWNKNKDLLSKFFESGFDINYQKPGSLYTLIHWAAQVNYSEEIFDLLFNQKPNIELIDAWGFTPLLRAADKGSLFAFNYLIKRGACITKLTSKKMNLLHLIAQKGDVALLEPLKSLDVTVLVDAKDKNGLTPVCHAAKKKQLPILKSLVVDFKASLVVRDADDDSVLRYAIESGDDEVCHYLLDQQSLLGDIKNKLTQLLFQAIQSKVSDTICERIASLGGDFNAQSDDDEKTILLCAAKNEKFKFMRYIIERGVKIDESYEENIYDKSMAPRRGRGVRRPIGQIYITALYELIKDLKKDISEDSELYKTIECLIKKGANLYVRNSVEGQCHVLTELVEKELFNLVRLFIHCGVNVSTVDKEWSLLQYPAASGNLLLTKLLVEQGAKVDFECDYNPIVIAAACGQQEMIEFFISKAPSSLTLPGKIAPRSIKNHLELIEENFDEDDIVDVIRHSKVSALHAAILEDHDELIQFLVQKSLPVDIMCNGMTPIQLAVILNARSSISKLLEYNPNLFVLKEGSKTLLHLMIEYSDVETLKLFDKDILKKWIEMADASGDKALHLAVKDNKKDMLEYLLELGANIDSKGSMNKTPLHHAVSLDRKNLVQLLLDKEANVKALDSEGRCALHYVKSASIATLLLEQDEENECVSLQDAQGNTPLHLSRSLEVVSVLLEHNAGPEIENKKGENCLFTLLTEANQSSERLKIADKLVSDDLIDAFDKSGKAIIHVVCKNNDLKALKWLCNNNVDLDAQTRDENGDTASIIAIENGFENIMSALIDHGADINKPRKKFLLTPLMVAIWENKSPGVVRLLLKHQASVGNKDISNKTALDYIVSFSRVESFKVFQECGLDLYSQDASGKTLLHTIAKEESTAIYECLSHEQILRLNIPDNQGNMPLHIALETGKEKITGLLLSLGTEKNVTNNSGETILHSAVKAKVSTALIDKILALGVDPNIKDKSRCTAIECAAKAQDFVRLFHMLKVCTFDDSEQYHAILQILCKHVDENTKEDSELYRSIDLVLNHKKHDKKNVKELLRRVIHQNSLVVTQLFERSGLIISEVDFEKSLIIPQGHDDKCINTTMLAYLIKQGVNVKHSDFPLAALIGGRLRGLASFEAICLLVENGADVNQPLKEGGKTLSLLTALCGIGSHSKEIAEDELYPLVEYLVDKGADINYLDNDKNSSLHLAAICNFTRIAKLLIDRGANTKLRNNKGQTPMKAAREAKHDSNYLYVYIDQRQQKQDAEKIELQANVRILEKKIEIINSSFAHYRRMTEKELKDLREKTQGYNPRFVGNISAEASDAEGVAQQKTDQQNSGVSKGF